jgi:hypothetical protein
LPELKRFSTSGQFTTLHQAAMYSGRRSFAGAASGVLFFGRVDDTMTNQELWHELGCPQRPRKISQEQFENYDPDRYERLCQMCETEAKLPGRDGPFDLDYYLDDLMYVKETQPDLLVFLLPLCLRAWSMNLLGETAYYANYAERFWLVWKKGPSYGAKAGAPLFDFLSQKQQGAFERYVSETIIEAIDRGRRLRSKVHRHYCYGWIPEVASFATVRPALPQLFNPWWGLDTEGRAIGALQYISTLMYEDKRNPIFPPWTPDQGGGAPHPWADSMPFKDQPWDAANVSFLQEFLIPSRLLSTIEQSLARLTDAEDKEIARRMKADFESQAPLLELRLEQLPAILSSDELIVDWPGYDRGKRE